MPSYLHQQVTHPRSALGKATFVTHPKYVTHIRFHLAKELIWRLSLRRCAVPQTHERHRFRPKPRGRPESRNIPRVTLVVIPTSCSAAPFDEGEYCTDEIIRILRSSHNSFVLPATSSFALPNMTALMFFLVPFCSWLTHFSNSIGASDFVLKGNTQLGS